MGSVAMATAGHKGSVINAFTKNYAKFIVLTSESFQNRAAEVRHCPVGTEPRMVLGLQT